MQLPAIVQKKQLDTPFRFEKNLITIPFFVFQRKGKNRKAFSLKWLVEGVEMSVSCEAFMHGVSGELEQDVLTVLSKIYYDLGEPEYFLIYIEQIARLLGLKYPSNGFRIRKALKRLRYNIYTIVGTYKDPVTGELRSPDTTPTLVETLEKLYDKNGKTVFRIRLADFIRNNTTKHKYFQLIDFSWYKRLRTGLTRKLYFLLERSRYSGNSLNTSFKISKKLLKTSLPIENKNPTNVKNTLQGLIDNLKEVGYLSSCNIYKNKEKETIYEFFYTHASPSELKQIGSPEASELKAAEKLKTDICSKIGETQLSTSEVLGWTKVLTLVEVADCVFITQKFAKTNKTAYLQAEVYKKIETKIHSKNPKKIVYSRDVVETQLWVNQFLEIDAVTCETMSRWDSLIGVEAVREVAKAVKETNCQVFERYGNLLISIEAFMNQGKNTTHTKSSTKKEPHETKNYSDGIKRLRDDINYALEINSLSLDTVETWLNKVGIEGIKYYIRKTIDNAKNTLSRHGYMTKCMDEYIKQYGSKSEKKESSQKETNKSSEKKQTEDQKQNENLDSDCITHSSPYDYVKECKKSITNIFGDTYYKVLLSVVMENPKIYGFNIPVDKYNNSDKGYFIVFLSDKLSHLSDSAIQQIKTNMEEMYPIENVHTDIDEPNNATGYQDDEIVLQDLIKIEIMKSQDLSNYDTVRPSSSIKKSGKTKTEYCDDYMEEDVVDLDDMEEDEDDDDLDYIEEDVVDLDDMEEDEDDDESVVIDIKAKTVKKVEKPIKEKKSKTKVVETVKDIPVSMTFETPIEFVKIALTGEQLKEARERAGFTIRELASKLGCHNTYINKWETGQRSVPTKYSNAIKEFLKI